MKVDGPRTRGRSKRDEIGLFQSNENEWPKARDPRPRDPRTEKLVDADQQNLYKNGPERTTDQENFESADRLDRGPVK